MKAIINEAELYYIDVGRTGEVPIVLIHGFPFSHRMWRPQIEILQKQYRVIAYDVRGHGESEVGDGQYTIELFVDDLIALLDHLKVEKAVLCGLSMGGYIVLRAVERDPERCLALVLCDTSSEADTNEAKLRRASSIKAVKRDGVKAYSQSFAKVVFAPETFEKKPEIVDVIRATIESNSVLGICGTLLALAGRTETTKSLPRFLVPTLIMVGELDKVTPPSLSIKIHEGIRESELHLIPNAAHMSNLESPDEFNTHLLNFLNKQLLSRSQKCV